MKTDINETTVLEGTTNGGGRNEGGRHWSWWMTLREKDIKNRQAWSTTLGDKDHAMNRYRPTID